MSEIGNLRAIRESRGISRREVAEKLGVTIPAIQDYERNEIAGTITLSTLRRYASVLGCEVNVQICPKDKPPTPPPPSASTLVPAGTSTQAPNPTPLTQKSELDDRMGLWTAPVID